MLLTITSTIADVAVCISSRVSPGLSSVGDALWRAMQAPTAAVILTIMALAGPAVLTASADCRVSGIVVEDATGAPVANVTVRMPGRQVTTGSDGTFCFEQVDRSRTLTLILSVIDSSGNHVECLVEDIDTLYVPVTAEDRDNLAVAVAKPDTPDSLELRLKPVSDSQVEAFCTSCHTWNPCYSEATPEQLALIFDSNVAGVFVRTSEVSALLSSLRSEGLSSSQYKSIRYTCIHARPVDMVDARHGPLGDMLRMPSSLPLINGRTTSCDTCHTRHSESFAGYLRLAQDTPQNALCHECHK